MLELPLSIFVWLAVIFFQALVHYRFVGLRRRVISKYDTENPPPSVQLDGRQQRSSSKEASNVEAKETSSKETESPSRTGHEECQQATSTPPPLNAAPMVPPPHALSSDDERNKEEQEGSLDGDEPELFFRLLEQTGSEMTNVSVKLAGSCWNNKFS
jgi:hypothetical protein